MSDKQAMQADGSETTTKGENGRDGASRTDGPGQTGESGGGAYPNPHTGKGGSANAPDRFMGHGGQTDIEYHGPGQGDSKGGGDANAAADED